MAGLPLPSNSFVYKRVAGTDPAANAEVGDTVPAGKTWWLLSVSVALAQGATQTPQPVLQIQDGSNVSIFESFGSSAAQAVSTTCQYTWAGDVQLTGQIGATTNVHSCAPLPQNLVIGPGFQIKTTTVGIGANSNYGAPAYYVIEFTN